MDTRRRVVLPRDLVQAVGLEAGEDVVLTTHGDGSIVLRSRTTVMRLIRDELDAAFSPASAEQTDAAISLRVDRDADDARLNSRLTASSDDPDAAGAALLGHLGL